MNSIASWARSLFNHHQPRATGLARAERALDESKKLIERMREASISGDPVRGIFADMWLERHNIPYVTTMFEANEEMKSATDQPNRDRKKT